jgi:hypothetical protein
VSTDVIWLSDLTSGRLEREVFGSTPFADVPESPYYRPSPGSWLSVRSWLDEDGYHVVMAHDCRETREVHVLPWPTWQAHDGQVTPSFSCDGCGVHTLAQIGHLATTTHAPDASSDPAATTEEST